jgi:hypothetical protein
VQELAGIPTWLADDVAEFGLAVTLDATYELTKNYTGDYFYQELQGRCLPDVPCVFGACALQCAWAVLTPAFPYPTPHTHTV